MTKSDRREAAPSPIDSPTVLAQLAASVLPGYVVKSESYVGINSVVFRGSRTCDTAPVAVKINRSPEPANAQASPIDRVLTLRHPHLVRTYEVVRSEGRRIVVMELCSERLSARLHRTGYERVDLCAAVVRLLAGLSYAHGEGLLHCDVSTANLLIAGDGTIRLADFGLVKTMDDGARGLGVPIGTPAYLSPEQARGAPIDTRSDIYSAGAVLYELLTGWMPFPEVTTTEAALQQRITSVATPVSEVSNVPAAMAVVVDKALARRPQDRHQSADEFANAIGVAAQAELGLDWLERATL